MNVYAFTIALGLLLLAVAGLLIRPAPVSVVVAYTIAAISFAVAVLASVGVLT